METMDTMKVKDNLARLRERWLNEPSNRPIIERMARCQQIILEKIEKRLTNAR